MQNERNTPGIVLPAAPLASPVGSGQAEPSNSESTMSDRQPVGTGVLIAAGAVWSIIQTFATKAVVFLGQLLLAWLLSSEDFGLIGMAYTVTTFVSLLINPGIDVILVRRGKHFHLWSSPAFFFGLTTGLLGCVVILAISPAVAHFYRSPDLVGVLAVLAIATPLGALMLVPTAKLRSELRFKSLAAIGLLQAVLQTLLTVGFAAAGFGVYSFVLPMPFVYLAAATILWIVARPTINVRTPIRYWKYLIGDSSYIFGARALQTATSQADYILLGALYNASVVGPYFFAYVFAKQAIRLTAGSMQAVLMSGLSRFSAFSNQQTNAALRATKGIALFGMPLCMIQAAVVDPLLRALYGDKWLAAIPLVQLISLGLAFDVPSWAAGSLLESRGQFKFTFRWSLLFATIFIVGISIGAWYGAAFGTALAVCLFFTVCSPMLPAFLFRVAGVSWAEILEVYWRPFIVGILASGTALLSIRLLAANGGHLWLQFCVATGLGLAIMCVGSRVFVPSAWSEITTKVAHAFPSVSLFRR